MKSHLKYLIPALALFVFAACGEHDDSHHHHGEKSYAIYAEYAKANVVMKDGLNRRMFDTVEAQHGSNIRLEKDGSITLEKGTYRLSGFSFVTMQSTTAPVTLQHNDNYPGYCLVYYKKYEQQTDSLLGHRIGVGSAMTAQYMAPSVFDLVFTCKEATQICVGHQSGDTLHGEVYFTLNDVGGVVSPYHVFARIAIDEL